MSHLRACAITVMIAINTVFWGLPIHLLALVKLLAWRSSWKKACAGALMRAVQGWIGGVLFVQDHFLPINWDIQGTDDLHREKWYIVICNHHMGGYSGPVESVDPPDAFSRCICQAADVLGAHYRHGYLGDGFPHHETLF